MGTQAADKCDKYRYNDHIAHKNVWFRYSYTCSKKNLAKTYTFEKFRFLPPGGFCVRYTNFNNHLPRLPNKFPAKLMNFATCLKFISTAVLRVRCDLG